MKTERVPFVPLRNDIDDDRIERLAREKGVGTFDLPEREEQGASVARPTVAPTPKSVIDEGSGATPRSRMKTVNLELPDYVWTELKIQAVQQQTSLRHVVMTALKVAGHRISDVDMVEDGRRLRGGNQIPA